MDRYDVIQVAGSGNFSDVYKARDLVTLQIVAIKEMKKCEEVEDLALKELKILSTLSHPNIIQVREVIRNHNDIKVVFEYVSQNLLELYQSSKNGINENQIKCILYQSAFALEYLHAQKKIIHRDIKPQNILIDRKHAMIKVIDFGLAKEEKQASTDYVATRWYRAPENLVGLRKSTTAIDIFALACVMVQLYTLNPLFPGDNTLDQLYKVFNILGTPTEDNWPAGYCEMKRKGISMVPKQRVSLQKIMPNASQSLVDLLEQMLVIDPQKRIAAREVMQHPFFQKVERVIPGSIYKQAHRYIDETDNQKKKILMAKSLSPDANLLSLRFPGQQVARLPSECYLKDFNGVSQLASPRRSPRDSKLQFRQAVLSDPNQPHFAPSRERQNQRVNIPSDLITPPNRIQFQPAPLQRQKRIISYKEGRVGNHESLRTDRNPDRHVFNCSELQGFKHNTHHQQPAISPKYNVKYFKESRGQNQSGRSSGLLPQRGSLALHKSMQHSNLPSRLQSQIQTFQPCKPGAKHN